MGTREAITIAGDIARPFEGYRTKPYLCPAGVPTIGYGTTRYPDGRRVTLLDSPCTEMEARTWSDWEISSILPSVLAACPVLAGDDRRLGAILSWTYNLGIARLRASTMRKKINAQDWQAARDECRKWVFASGRRLNGLVARREVEASYL